jgi:hypothetical protein
MNYNKNSFLGMFSNLFIGYADALLSTFGSPSIPPAPTQTNAPFHFQENFEYLNGTTNTYYQHTFMLNIN